MKRLLIILVWLTVISSPGAAQFFGFQLGAGACSFRAPLAETDPPLDIISDYSSLWSSSVSAGFMVVHPINNAFSVESGVNFLQKGGRENWIIHDEGASATDTTFIQDVFDEYRLSSIEVPLIINHDKSGLFGGFLVNKVVHFSFQRLADFKYIHQNQEVLLRNDIDGYDGNTTELNFINPYEISWVFGYRYHVKNYMHLGLGLSSGMTQVFETGAAPWLNYKTVEFRFSIRYFLNLPAEDKGEFRAMEST